ncbi:ash family protein [Budviciaceae bacterium BWR-B9]|uniref:Ash family protein n=1 Tax=Limnobaculum allomyrinae TaxID=2791986 RepID=A0ABS1IUG2_9GAMM|nr:MULTISPECIES: ash family protein [Limnobaculum]MBK5145413.1 ash family protein [Limnobaculum allomyrinae]MBV7693159.1 ash family protein [Limnobaculum sp. M2-1]
MKLLSIAFNYLTGLCAQGYSDYASAKSGVGIDLSDIYKGAYTAQAVFLCVSHKHIQIYGGLARASSEAPGSFVAGKVNLVSSPPLIDLNGGDNSTTEENHHV